MTQDITPFPHSEGDRSLDAAGRRPIVNMIDGSVLADSRDVAAFFCKQHYAVLRDVRNLIAKEPSLGLRNFVCFKNNDLTGETTSHYLMDRDGFTLLAMGFTGQKAIKWKLSYIEAFNSMEASLRAPRITFDPSDPRMLLACFEHLQKQVAEKDGVIALQAKGLEKLERIEGADGSMCITDAAKTLGTRPRDLFALMNARRWIFKRPGNSSWLAYQDKIQAGLMEHDDHLYRDGQDRERVATRALVTAKGLVRLAEILNEPLH
ncbi:Rha family transcriptional regulator [Methylorubrum extorquens]|uniref:Phage regulatory protein, Rha family n=1 Tax=Methylorubrum extorquens DSM 13060 TaxID=882800 RepID=H1KC64_METEX|nr:phage regulatory protein/antirepressor Ant [Methylorubrum extorquens]EHP94881.1 phage regulatory protein, Rha family [Methylorubrum extorquens DSM 13060]